MRAGFGRSVYVGTAVMGRFGMIYLPHLALAWSAFHRRQGAIAVQRVELCGLVQLIPDRKERAVLRLGHLFCRSRDCCGRHVLYAVFHVAKTGRLVAQAAIHCAQDLKFRGVKWRLRLSQNRQASCFKQVGHLIIDHNVNSIGHDCSCLWCSDPPSAGTWRVNACWGCSWAWPVSFHGMLRPIVWVEQPLLAK